MQLHMAICDDEAAERDYLAMLAGEFAARRGIFMQIEAFSSAEGFLFACEEKCSFDILLLDIQMPGMDGVSLARLLRRKDRALQLIFVTGFPDFMADGFEVSAVHYLMKPVDREKLFAALDRALENLSRAEPCLTVSEGAALRRIPFSAILYLEAQGHYVKIAAGGETIQTRAPLSELETLLDGRFFRCQRSFIVSLPKTRRISKTAVTLENDAEIPLSRGLYDEIHRAFIRYFP